MCGFLFFRLVFCMHTCRPPQRRPSPRSHIHISTRNARKPLDDTRVHNCVCPHTPHAFDVCVCVRFVRGVYSCKSRGQSFCVRFHIACTHRTLVLWLSYGRQSFAYNATILSRAQTHQPNHTPTLHAPSELVDVKRAKSGALPSCLNRIGQNDGIICCFCQLFCRTL